MRILALKEGKQYFFAQPSPPTQDPNAMDIDTISLSKLTSQECTQCICEFDTETLDTILLNAINPGTFLHHPLIPKPSVPLKLHPPLLPFLPQSKLPLPSLLSSIPLESKEKMKVKSFRFYRCSIMMNQKPIKKKSLLLM